MLFAVLCRDWAVIFVTWEFLSQHRHLDTRQFCMCCKFYLWTTITSQCINDYMNSYPRSRRYLYASMLVPESDTVQYIVYPSIPADRALWTLIIKRGFNVPSVELSHPRLLNIVYLLRRLMSPLSPSFGSSDYVTTSRFLAFWRIWILIYLVRI